MLTCLATAPKYFVKYQSTCYCESIFNKRDLQLQENWTLVKQITLSDEAGVGAREVQRGLAPPVR